jgi:anti-sigma regulatory factor (Ser/Thr protein kinase)
MIGLRTSRRRHSVSSLLPDRFFFSVAGGPRAPADARDRAADRLAWVLNDEGLDDLRLIMSELTTNCVQHAHADGSRRIEVAVSLQPETVRVSVATDGPSFEPGPEHSRRCPPTDAHGRGLYIVDRLASAWGVADRARNAVWFELARPQRA